jgi:flagellar biosynthesis/type III secretory pathway protein FliH
MPGCEEWPEESVRVDPAMAAAGLLRTRGQLEAQMSQLTVLLKAVELAAQRVDLDTQLRECEEEAYEEGKHKGHVAAAAAAAEGRRFICLSIASARGDLQNLRAAARSLPQHGLGTLLVSAGESQVKPNNTVTVAIVCWIFVCAAT